MNAAHPSVSSRREEMRVVGWESRIQNQNSKFENRLFEQILPNVRKFSFIDQPEAFLELVDEPGNGLAAGADGMGDVRVSGPTHHHQ